MHKTFTGAACYCQLKCVCFPSFLLRSGLAIVFLYAAVSGFLNPGGWIGFFPAWFPDSLSLEILLIIWGIAQIAVAVWLISGHKSYAAAVVSVVMMFLIIIVNITSLDIVFRDIAILFMAVTLAAISTKAPDKRTVTPSNSDKTTCCAPPKTQDHNIST